MVWLKFFYLIIKLGLFGKVFYFYLILFFVLLDLIYEECNDWLMEED